MAQVCRAAVSAGGRRISKERPPVYGRGDDGSEEMVVPQAEDGVGEVGQVIQADPV